MKAISKETIELIKKSALSQRQIRRIQRAIKASDIFTVPPPNPLYFDWKPPVKK